MDPVTPLRRSERIRRSSSKALGSSPSSSPGVAANVGRSKSSRSKVFSPPDSQTSSDSTLRNTTPSESSGSFKEDPNSISTTSMMMAARFPTHLYQAYLRLDHVLRLTDEDLMIYDISTLGDFLKDINALLVGVMGTGRSREWPHYASFTRVCSRMLEAIKIKKSALLPEFQRQADTLANVLQFPVQQDVQGMRGDDWHEPWKDSDSGYVQTMYRNAAAPSIFSWDDVGASGSQTRVEETAALGYSLSYPQSNTLDYCSIPDSY